MAVAPCVDLYDVETYEGKVLAGTNITDNTRRQKYLNARKGVLIDIDRLYYWLFRAQWDCNLSITGSASIGQELFDGPGIQNYYTKKVQSVEKVGVAQHGRDRKIVVPDSRGKSILVDDTTNPLPANYPKDILYKIRSNPCFQTNGSTVYFDVIYKVEDFVFDVRFQNQPPPTPNFGPLLYDVSTQRKEYGLYFFYLVSYKYSAPVQCEIYFKAESYGAAYDVERKKYLPDIGFGYSGPINWVGLNPLDEEYPNSFPTKSRLSVDGLSIPSSTGFDMGFGGAESGQLDISAEWVVAKERDL